AVAGGSEDTVECGVDLVVFVGPETRLAPRVHPRMRRARHEAAAFALEDLVDFAYMAGEKVVKTAQAGGGAVGLDLHHVQHELVGPGESAALHFGGVFARHGVDDVVAAGKDIECARVDDHVLDLDPDTFEETERLHASDSLDLF